MRPPPNSHDEAALRPFTEQDEPFRAYFAVQQMVADISGYLNHRLSERARQTSIHVVTVGIGCTGGQHRSVFVAEHLRDWYATAGSTPPNNFSASFLPCFLGCKGYLKFFAERQLWPFNGFPGTCTKPKRRLPSGSKAWTW